MSDATRKAGGGSSRYRQALEYLYARTTGGVSLQPANAADAARTAASTSLPVDSGVLAITTPRAGLCTSTKSVADEGAQRPLMKLESTVGSDTFRLLAPRSAVVFGAKALIIGV